MKKKTLLKVMMTVMLIASVQFTFGQSMSVNPFKIVVNAIGNSQDLVCAFPGIIPSGYQVSSVSLDLSFAGTSVSQAYFLDYCWTDNMFFAQFERIPILQDAYVVSLAGTQVMAHMTGSYVLTDAAGNNIFRNVDLWDYVEIEKPGKKK